MTYLEREAVLFYVFQIAFPASLNGLKSQIRESGPEPPSTTLPAIWPPPLALEPCNEPSPPAGTGALVPPSNL